MALTRITKGVIKPNENYDTHNINSTGIVTAIGLDVNGNGDISGNLSVGGVLTYEDVTSIDSVGIITAQSDIHVGAGVSAVGVGTFGSLDIGGDIDVDGHTELDNVSVSGILTVTADHPRIRLVDTNANDDFQISNYNGTFFITDQTDNHNRFSINSAGRVDVFGALYGGGRLDIAGNAFIHTNLDVDGHTNLDNVSIAGVTTTTGNIHLNSGAKVGFATDSNTFIGQDDYDRLDFNVGGKRLASIVEGTNIPVLVIDKDGVNTARSNQNTNYNANPHGTELVLGNTSSNNHGLTIVSPSTNYGVIFFSDGSGGGLDATRGSITFTHSDNKLTLKSKIGSIALNHKDDEKLITTDAGISILKDLDVDGHTNLDNVSVAGVTTFSNNVKFDGATAGRDVTFIRSSNTLEFATNTILELGNGGSGDCRLFNNGTDTRIINGDGTLKFESDTYEFKDKDNTTSYLNITSDGALLLGTSTRSNLENFHIHTASSDKAIIKFTNTATGTGTGDGFEFGLNSNEDVELMLKEDKNIIFGTGSTLGERLRITSDGVIGINDNNPGSGKKVKVVVANNSSYQMAVNLTNNINADINFYIKTNESLIAPSTNTPLCLGTGGAEKLRIDSSGRLFTGGSTQLLDSTAGALHISGGTAGGRLAFRGTTTSAETGIAEVFAFWDTNKVAGMIAKSGTDTTNKDDGSLHFYTNTGSGISERVTITSTGAVMINTTNSSSRTLNLRGNFGIISTNQTGVMTMDVTDAGVATIAPFVAGGSTLILKTNASGVGVSERLRITSDGFVGINDDVPYTGLTINKEGDYWDTNGNTYAHPVGRVLSTWRGDRDDDTDYWVGFVGKYLKPSATVNILLQPHVGNFNNQAGMYIAGEATGNFSSVLTIGKIISGNQAGRGTSGAQRATKTEIIRVNPNTKILHTRTDNTTRYDVEFRNTGGISDGNYGGIQFTQGGSGATNLAAIEIAYANTGRPDIVFRHRNRGGGNGFDEAMRITSNAKIGINNNSPECRTGGIDMSSNDGTSGKNFTDLRGHSQLILRNPSTTQHSFTQLLFENGGGTSAATMLRHRLGPSSGNQQNFVGDLCLFRRTGNAGGSNNDYRESTRFCGATEQARQIWWASGDTDTGSTTRLGWHHLSAERDHPGTDAYTFFRLETGAASYARNGMGKYTVVWTTGHASGYGLQIGHFGYYMHHGSSTIVVNEHIIHRERYSNGSYYGWNDSPGMRIINSSASGGTNACIVFRCGGRRHAGYDMSVVVGLFVDLYVPESANGDSNPRLYVAGNSESNLAGGGFGNPVSHAYVNFTSNNPNHSGQP